MNACFTNMLLDLQKEERRQQELAEKKIREKEQRKQDLLKGNPFKLSTLNRAGRIRRSPYRNMAIQGTQNSHELLMKTQYIGKNALR